MDLVKSLIWLRVLYFYLTYTRYSFNEIMFCLMKELPGISYQDLENMRVDEFMWYFQRLEKFLHDREVQQNSKGMSIS